VARGSGSETANDTLSSAWQPCVECIHLFKEQRRFPEVFSHDASSMWCDDLRASLLFADSEGSVTDISLHPGQIRKLAVVIRISSAVRLVSLCSPYVRCSATPSSLTAPAPCIIHALLLLAIEGELPCRFSLISAPPASFVHSSTAVLGWSCGRAVVQVLYMCCLSYWAFGVLFTHSCGATYVRLSRWSFIFLHSPPPSLSHSSPFTYVLPLSMRSVTRSFNCMFLDAILSLLGRAFRRVDARQARFVFHQ